MPKQYADDIARMISEGGQGLYQGLVANPKAKPITAPILVDALSYALADLPAEERNKIRSTLIEVLDDLVEYELAKRQ